MHINSGLSIEQRRELGLLIFEDLLERSKSVLQTLENQNENKVDTPHPEYWKSYAD
jgi:hypothetical protein